VALSAGVYLNFSGVSKSKSSIQSLSQRVEIELQRIGKRTAPAVYAGEPMGFVIAFENGAKFYFAGDTGPMADMKLVIHDYYNPDVAVLPIGNFFTMGPAGAAYSTYLVNPKKYVIPDHYASFPMLVKDATEFTKALEQYNLTAQPLIFQSGQERSVMGVKMVWLGHGAWLLTSPEGKNILIDPGAKFSFVWPEKYKDFAAFGKIDMVLLTHAHPDHVIVSDLEKLVNLYNPVILVGYEAGILLKEKLGTATILTTFGKGGSLAKEEFAAMGLPAEKVGNIRIDAVSASHSASFTPE